MKKVILLTLMSFYSLFTFSQKIYNDKTEYLTAMNQYNDELDSYLNYTKKLNYLKNFNQFPDLNHLPKNQLGWVEFLTPFFIKENIRHDNPKKRLYPNVKSNGTVFTNFYLKSNQIVVNNTDKSMLDDPNCLFSADYSTFDHPGKPPIYQEKKPIVSVNQIVPTNQIVETKKEINVIYVPPVKYDLYLMPDGNKYTYEELILIYPTLKNEMAMKNNFK